MKSITITKRFSDWHACVAGEPGKWGAGSSPDEAVGSLVRSWPEVFSVSLKWESSQYPTRGRGDGDGEAEEQGAD